MKLGLLVKQFLCLNQRQLFVETFSPMTIEKHSEEIRQEYFGKTNPNLIEGNYADKTVCVAEQKNCEQNKGQCPHFAL